MKTAVLVITVPLLAKEGLGEVDYDLDFNRRSERDKRKGLRINVSFKLR